MECKYCDTECEKVVDGNEYIFKRIEDVSDYVGKNRSYFSKQFTNAEYGYPLKFNWAAFFFNIYYCLYRKQYGILWRYFGIPLIALAAVFGGGSLCVLSELKNMDTGLINTAMAMGALSFIIMIWYFISSILMAKNFNKLYYENLKRNLTNRKDTKKFTGTSVGNVFIWMILTCAFCCVFGTVVSGAAIKYSNEYAGQNYSVSTYENNNDINEENDDVVYGYNSYIDGGISTMLDCVYGYYDIGDGVFLSIDKDLNLKLYSDGECCDFAHMYVANSDEDSVTLGGTINQKYCDLLDIETINGVEFQFKFMIQNGMVTNIYTSDTYTNTTDEIPFNRLSEQEFHEETGY
ncbi:MAG: hypothetical protein LKJ13_09795 [Clostridia bacterium]|jgi:hypothetical protein|nr:hypothetical protein [Clostridia bacterium]MCI2000584.1 hypothetical protein [Clostridia bacterium]MCI2015040.1 hypothetical protein [Clostridia bacterium]